MSHSGVSSRLAPAVLPASTSTLRPLRHAYSNDDLTRISDFTLPTGEQKVVASSALRHRPVADIVHATPSPLSHYIVVPTFSKAAQLRALNTKKSLGLRFLDCGQIRVCDLQKEFERVRALSHRQPSLSESEMVLLSEYQLHMIKTIEVSLNRQVTIVAIGREDPMINKIGKRIAFLIFFCLGATVDGVNSFIGFQQIIISLFHASNGIALGVAVGLCLINVLLFRSFEGQLLKKNFGIDSLSNLGKTILIHDAKLNSVQNINNLMRKEELSRVCDPVAYLALAEIVDSFNHDMVEARVFYERGLQPESCLRKFVRYGLTLFGSVMTIGSGYFAMHSLVLTIHASLMATPWGWVIIGVGILTMLTFYFSMRGKAVLRNIYPGLEKYEDVRSQFLKFEEVNRDMLLRQYRAWRKLEAS